MIRICVIGDIGSGKSYVAKQFGFPIFNADAEVRKIYKKNRKCFKKLKKTIPNHTFSFPIKKKQFQNIFFLFPLEEMNLPKLYWKTRIILKRLIKLCTQKFV